MPATAKQLRRPVADACGSVILKTHLDTYPEHCRITNALDTAGIGDVLNARTNSQPGGSS
jgi:hypothetical protein